MAARVAIERLVEAPKDHTPLVVVKTPLPDDGVDRRAEAQWLESMARPGIVELHHVAERPFAIVTRHAGGLTLRTGHLSPSDAAEMLAAVAEILAEIHDEGSAHGKLTADHIVIGPDGPRLCSPSGTSTDPADDALGLASCIRTLGAQWEIAGCRPATEIVRWLELADHIDADPSALSARRLAVRFRRLGEHPGTERGALWSRRRVPTGIVAIVSAVTAIIGGLFFTSPEEESALGPVIEVEAERYRLGGPGDHAIALDRPCHPESRVLLFVQETAVVWGFAEVGNGAAGRPVARVPGGSTLTARTVGPPDEPCQVGVVRGVDGAATILPPTDDSVGQASR